MVDGSERGGGKGARDQNEREDRSKTETRSSCVTSVGARRDIPVSSDLCACHHGGGEKVAGDGTGYIREGGEKRG